MLGVTANSEESSVDLRVEGLDTSVKHLRGTGELGDIQNLESGVAELSSGSSSGEQLDALGSEELAERDKASLLRNLEQSASDAAQRLRGPTDSSVRGSLVTEPEEE